MKVVKVFGAPGTGKTTYLIAKVVELLQSGVSISEIAFIGYTRAACTEALDRAKKVTSGLSKDNREWFMTIHGASLKLLFSHGVYNGKEIATFNHFKQFCKLKGLKPPSSADELQEGGEVASGTAFFSTRSYLINTFGEDKDWLKVPHAQDLIAFAHEIDDKEPTTIYPRLAEAYKEWKETNNLVDFEDMLLDQFFLKIPLPVTYLIVDEFQDISPLQKALIEEWMKGKEKVYIAGDDDQALYGFQGADPTLMLEFPTNETVVLAKSYRCSEEIWQNSQELIRRNQKRQPKEVESKGVGGAVKILSTSSIWDVVKEIPRYTPLFSKPKSTFILLRTNYLVSKISWKLSDTHTLFRYIDADKDKVFGLTPKKVKLLNWVNAQYGVDKYRKLEYLGRQDGYSDMAIRWLSGYIGVETIDLENIPVKLGTIHSAKGKEADIVILFNDITPRVAKSYKENPEEERRVWYVGETRAREKLVIVNKFFGSRSISFDEMLPNGISGSYEERY